MINNNIKPTFIDLFAGCGGLSLGLMDAGWSGLFAIEKNADAFKTLRHNLVDRGDHNKSKILFNWPSWLEIGPIDIRRFYQKNRENIRDLEGKVDLIVGGPPCQGFSFAGKQLAFDDPRSKLFFEFVKALEILKPKYFLLENVKMKKEFEEVITNLLGVQPIEINSALVSAQTRKRLYWTNIPNIYQPEDKGIMLDDVINLKEIKDAARQVLKEIGEE